MLLAGKQPSQNCPSNPVARSPFSINEPHAPTTVATLIYSPALRASAMSYPQYPPLALPPPATMPTTPPSNSNPSHQRIHTYTSHALTLTTVYGIPLTSGLWLEYYYTSVFHHTSLLLVSSIFGAQFACLCTGSALSEATFTRWPHTWRLQMSLGAACVCAAWGVLFLTAPRAWSEVLCHGVLTGTGLGVLGASSTRTLSTHYNGDVGLTSGLCSAAGFAGAVVYAVATWDCLRRDEMRLACGVTLGLMVGTLLVAICLSTPHSPPPPPPPPSSPSTHTTHSSPHRRPTFLLLAALVFGLAVLIPLYVPLLLTQSPSAHRTDTGVYALLSLFTTALLSSTFLPRLAPSRVAPHILLGACACLSGAAVVGMLGLKGFVGSVLFAAVCGVGVGGVCVLGGRVFTEGQGAGETRGCWTWVRGLGNVAASLAIGGGVVGAAAVMERWEMGGNTVLGVVGGYLVVGGVVVWWFWGVVGGGGRLGEGGIRYILQVQY